MTTTAENGRKLAKHDGASEVSVCGKCGELIDWTNEILIGDQDTDNDTSCPFCGHEDTGYLYATVAALGDRTGEAHAPVVGLFLRIRDAIQAHPAAEIWLLDDAGQPAEYLRPDDYAKRDECYSAWPERIWGG